MKLNNVNSHKVLEEIWMRPVFETDGKKINVDNIGMLSPTDIKGRYRFSTGTEYFTIELNDTALAMDLNDFLQRYPHLTQVMNSAKDGSFMFKVVFFSRLIDMADVEVGIDSRIEDTARRHKETFKNLEELASILQKRCEITDGINKWFLIKTGAAAEDDFIDDSEKDDSNEGKKEKLSAFSIYGEEINVPVEKKMLDRDTEIYFASKIVYKKYHNDERALILVSGNLKFCENAKQIQAFARNAMQIIEEQDGSYLKAWDRYADEEGKLLLEKARAVGEIYYTKVEKDKNGCVNFYIDGVIPEALSENDELELVMPNDIPPFLKDMNMKWEEYRNLLEAQYKERKEQEEEEKKNSNKDESEQKDDESKKSKSESFKVAERKDHSITLENADPDTLPGKVLILSTLGDIVQIDRRIKARLAIKEGRSAMPLLGLIIEETAALPDSMRVTKLKPITPFVENKIFYKNKPTDRQKEAIEMALNTPDMAIIQGPPGTGKTTVIAAILERLNEEYDKKNSIRGKILVSGFQHDAVENIISRLSVNSLPAIKFGKRSGEDEEDETITQMKIREWTEDLTTKLSDKELQLQPIAQQQELQILLLQYSKSRSTRAMEKLLDAIISLPGDCISKEAVSKAKNLRESLKQQSRYENLNSKQNVTLIRGLRTTENDFSDDGARNAMKVYSVLHEQLQPKEVELLKKAGHWKTGEPTTFLKELDALKTSLLDRFTPLPFFIIEKPKKEILELFAEVNESLLKYRGRGCKKVEILAGFFNELKYNPEGIKTAIEDYNFVYAATTQGAEGREIRNVKAKSKGDYVTYDTVIIDEAARASPLDLLIPMAQAEKRIILVGDHRQLPHIIDEDIIKKAMETKEKSEDTQTQDKKDEQLSDKFEDYIRRSAFEYLKGRLEKLTAKDGIKRTCTLDQQYRTHPLLGNLINKSFYAQYGEGFDSPLKEEHFKHNLPGLNGKPALWINVPGDRGHEKRSGTSWTRREEAAAIVQQLKKWLDCEEGKNFTFGVISFYRAQSNIIMEEAEKLGITDRISDGKWEINNEYRYLSREKDGKKTVEERLRIGTVDSFQGMEFDVVFLSMVRSLKDIPKREKGIYSQKVITQTFGRLVLENLLCVSMSRQKKVLAVAGDAKLALSDIGREAVPALAAFYELCKKEGKSYDS